MRSILEELLRQKEDIEKQIAENIKEDWSISRISKIDLTL